MKIDLDESTCQNIKISCGIKTPILHTTYIMHLHTIASFLFFCIKFLVTRDWLMENADSARSRTPWNIWWYLGAAWVCGDRGSCSQDLQTLVSSVMHLIAPWVFFPPFISAGITEGGSPKPLDVKSEPFFGSFWKACELWSQRWEMQGCLDAARIYCSRGKQIPKRCLWFFFISYVSFLWGLETFNPSVYLIP